MSSEDVVVAGIIIFALALSFFVLYGIFNTVINQMVGMAVINQSTTAVTALQSTQALTNRLDYVIFGVFIALVLAIIITGWFIGGNAIFMGMYFLITVIAVVFSTVLSNVWEQVTQSSIFGTAITHFPLSNNILLNLPLYTAIIGFLGLVVMFAKPYVSGGGNDTNG
jgi:hypothetical protein